MRVSLTFAVLAFALGANEPDHEYQAVSALTKEADNARRAADNDPTATDAHTIDATAFEGGTYDQQTTKAKNDPANHVAGMFCPPNYKLVAGAGSKRQSSYDEDRQFTKNHDSEADVSKATGLAEHHCEKCPAGQESNGGYSPTCHTPSTTWRTCSHMGCELVANNEHCKFHAAADGDINKKFPGTQLKTCAALNEKGQVKTGGLTERIRVYHHGHESEGTDHKCHLTGTRADGARTCECLCSNNGDQDDKWVGSSATGQMVDDKWKQDRHGDERTWSRKGNRDVLSSNDPAAMMDGKKNWIG